MSRTAEGIRIHRERLEIGKRLADCLEPVMTQEDVAKILGVSPTYVAHVERMALWKVYHRMQQLDSMTHPLDVTLHVPNPPDNDETYADPAND